MEGFGNHLTIDNHSQLVFAIFAHYYLFPFLFSVYFLQKRKNKNKRTILALDLWEGFSNILKQKEKISGIFVHGKEYGFGAHDFPISGVFEVEPKSCPGFIYRCSILLGCINMSFSEFRALIESVASEYHGDTYHLISKNCNHFTEDIVHRLTGKHIPGWVNRLARIGSLCSCLLPESLQVTTVKQLPEYHEMDGTETLSTASPGGSTEIDDTDPEKQLLSPKDGNSDISFIKEAQMCECKVP
uniref:PPPDE domain-containing protein n=1 Tax=Gossypium raimondii TaxID=29730 RepID=A0A0D2THQ9_GOSRA|nr:hypothetical protein B456_009G020000 [Gossypium raimondii]